MHLGIIGIGRLGSFRARALRQLVDVTDMTLYDHKLSSSTALASELDATAAHSIDEVIDNRLKEKVERMEKLINDDIPLFSRVDDTDETEIVKGVLEQYDDSQ